MLALPIATGVAGFIPSLVGLIVVFAFMLYSLMLLLEANLLAPEGSNIISMARQELGVWGEITAWLMYLLLLYAAIAAYIAGGGSLIHGVLQSLHLTSVNWISEIIFLVFFGTFVYFGTRSVDYINRFLTIGLIFAYLLLVTFVTPHAELDKLESGDAKFIWAALPIIALSFTSHLILPSIRAYYKSNVKHLLIVLLVGSLIPLIMYVAWEVTVLGIIPIEGKDGLQAIHNSAHSVSDLAASLSHYTQVSWLGSIAGFFSFFALVTSFLGASLSLLHFLRDGFKMEDNANNRVWLILLTYIPPFLFALFYPRGFVMALSYGGVFIAVLYGILPVLMVWKARYVEKRAMSFRVPGGKPALVIMFIAAIFIVVIQILATVHVLPALQ
ncbi:MAG: hypothetical protein JKY13_02440 [Gammaproteobacteria bacterium]|nr:hypothetical protein [Gammaproteobacteria bacterium]